MIIPRNTFYIFFVGVTMICLYVSVPSDSSSVFSVPVQETGHILPNNKFLNRSDLLLDFCPLHNLDPWDPKVRPLLTPTLDPLQNCVSTFEQITSIVHGRVVIKERENETECTYRCLNSFEDYQLEYGSWESLSNNSIPPCDVFEVRCFEQEQALFPNCTRNCLPNKPVYEYLHAHAFRPRPAPLQDLNLSPITPNVFLIILDSVSMSQFYRSMPKTAFFLREELQAVPFRHLNKVGYNSRPNGFALLTGTQVDDIPPSVVSVGHKADFIEHSDCNEHFPNEQTIMHMYQQAGFTTAYIEDIFNPIFAYPNCKGLRRPAADHQSVPFYLRVDNFSKHRSPTLYDNLFNKTCQEYHHINMEYLQSFIDKYPDKPKFAVAWMVMLAHNDHNSLFHTDEYFYQFFRRNQAMLRNSFVWVMADHGPRLRDDVRVNEVFTEEGYNPAMFFSVPDKLKRDREVMDVIRENSQKLVTHFDNFATLIDILETFNSSSPKPRLHGHSLMKRLPEPRTCDRLRIPVQFCMCNFNRTRVSVSDALNRRAASLFVERMNEELAASNESLLACSTLFLHAHAPITTDLLDDRDGFQFFEIRFKTTPGDGEYSGFFSRRVADDQLTVESDRFLRHGEAPSCVRRGGTYCHCNSVDGSSARTHNSTASS